MIRRLELTHYESIDILRAALLYRETIEFELDIPTRLCEFFIEEYATREND